MRQALRGTLKRIAPLVRGALTKVGLHIVRSRFSPLQLELYDSAPSQSPRFVNIGAGGFSHPHWRNLDMPNTFYGPQQTIHISHDLTSHHPFPLKSESIEIFYCSHVIEHLSDASTERMFGEVFRCLRPGGTFRITCPDMASHYRALMRGDTWFWKQPSGWGTVQSEVEQRFLEMVATLLTTGPDKLPSTSLRAMANDMQMEDFLESLCKLLPPDANALMPEGHCNWFTSDKVLRMLRSNGFHQAWESRYLQSNEPKLRSPCHFDFVCPEESLYVECTR
jgi:predicted SAM-dependent methyltransferase